ncbi:acyl-CoA N-acyltransferase [Suillus paluster]|uniref:acyl-CoA N-acyltransferase n=1 Tax=Suillus paluster TaxID=48578 RepID=UPI001B87DBF8|nr:acyl-CoA N-acyltransferase [Suillus paluster]KAG1734918.1 acyl-CoA N-acyltransferase [Suillus paluster]
MEVVKTLRYDKPVEGAMWLAAIHPSSGGSPTPMLPYFVNKVLDGSIRPDTGTVVYVVIDKTPAGTNPSKPTSGNFAGIIRTHITTNAIGLLLQYALDSPPHGLRLRRVQWRANMLNTKSIGAVHKFGLKLEAILRSDRAFVGSKASAANGVRVGVPRHDTVGTNTALLTLCWDDQESVRAQILQAMD